MKSIPLDLLNLIAQVIYDKKGFNILALDVRNLSNITDFMIIAEGNVDRHVMSIARALIDELREKGYKAVHVEGLSSGDWVVIDFSDVMVHLFMPGLREKFCLERLWSESQLIDLDIDVSKSAMS